MTTASPHLKTAPELEVAANLRLAVTRLARRLRQQSADGLSPSQTSALSTLERHGGLTPSELARIERIQRPTVTRVLAALEQGGLITRQPDVADRRSARVELTPAGAALLRRGRSRKNAYLARRVRDLDPQDLEALEKAAELIEQLLERDDRSSR
jgi:DNA-binding MarR family transcriptional regulator